MDKVTKATTSWSCVTCRKSGRKGANVVSVGGFYRHPKCEPTPVSDPAPTVDAVDAVNKSKPGSWFGASHDGECATCDGAIFEGATIRATGWGGYECADCGGHPWAQDEELRQHVKAGPVPEPADRCSEDGCTCEGHGGPEHELAAIGWTGAPAEAEVSHWQREAREAAARHMAADENDTPFVTPLKAELAVPAPAEPDPFDTPATVPVKLNVSGQPDAERDSYGRYLVKDPVTGDYRRFKNGNPIGITRTTTFVKAVSNNTAISDWKCRNILIGASLRPDLVRKAHKLTHEDNKGELTALCARLEEAAGAKVSADEGTFLHEFTERMDAGLVTWQDAPEAYQDSLKLYAETLERYGLEPVPGLIERTVFISEFGGVCGTFDRVYYHRASGTYQVGDVKTGKTLKYGMNEIEAQIWTYAHGINEHGVYDWNTKTWCIPVNPPGGRVVVSETQGIIVHMPVQGPDQGLVLIRGADLVAGAAHARLCHANRDQPKSKVHDWVPPLPALPPAPEVVEDDGIVDAVIVEDEPEPWGLLFSQVRTREEARALWDRAHAAGVSADELREYVALADKALVKG